MRDLRALTWLTSSLVRRLLREPQIVRSLLWPIALGPITLVLTVLVWVWIEGDWPVAVDPSTPIEVVQTLRSEGIVISPVEDAREAVASGRYNLGTDGHTVFAAADRGRTLELERVLRKRVDAPWMAAEPVPPRYDPEQGAKVTGVLGFLFVLFGVVFGAGMVARDRDDGTLEVELALGVRRWVHGTARWLAGTGVLALHFVLAVAVLDALMGIQQPLRLVANGTAACGTAVAIGLLVIGRGGLKSGFSGPLAAGISLATGLAAVGIVQPPGAAGIPIASLLSPGAGPGALAASLLVATVAITVFTLRSARS